MDFDPDTYEKISFDAIEPAKELIKLIKSNYKGSKFGVVMDIGCGPGNTAKMLAQVLSPERIIGVDIDPQMIEFAKNNNQMPNTEYYTQDISTEWKHWNHDLQKLEGKVSIIFANYALHWIQDWKALKRTTDNLSKLLSNTGLITINILYVGDIYRHLTPEERVKYEEWIKYPKEAEIMGQWISNLKDSGLSRIDIKYWTTKSIYPEQCYITEFIKWPLNWYKHYQKETVTGVNINDLIKDLIIKDRVTKLSAKSSKGEDMIEITQQVYNLVISK